MVVQFFDWGRVCARVAYMPLSTELRAKTAEQDRARTRESFLHALDLDVSRPSGA